LIGENSLKNIKPLGACPAIWIKRYGINNLIAPKELLFGKEKD
jgi:hypothetical protein